MPTEARSHLTKAWERVQKYLLCFCLRLCCGRLQYRLPVFMLVLWASSLPCVCACAFACVVGFLTTVCLFLLLWASLLPCACACTVGVLSKVMLMMLVLMFVWYFFLSIVDFLNYYLTKQFLQHTSCKSVHCDSVLRTHWWGSQQGSLAIHIWREQNNPFCYNYNIRPSNWYWSKARKLPERLQRHDAW